MDALASSFTVWLRCAFQFLLYDRTVLSVLLCGRALHPGLLYGHVVLPVLLYDRTVLSVLLCGRALHPGLLYGHLVLPVLV